MCTIPKRFVIRAAANPTGKKFVIQNPSGKKFEIRKKFQVRN